MRLAFLVILALACKDKTKSETPRAGSSAIASDALPPRASKPFDARALAQYDAAGWTRDVRLADARGLDVRYRAGAIVVTVQIAPCFDCLPMRLDRWQAKSDAMRALIAPELRELPTTTWELAMTELGGAPIVSTFYAGQAGTMYGTAYTLYFNNSVQMIRVAAESTNDAAPADVPRSRLEAAARAFLEAFVRRWG